MLSALAAQCRGRLICIVGCSGDQDEVSAQQWVWLSERLLTKFGLPRTTPEAKIREIIEDMQASLSAQQLTKVTALIDRGEAISQAVANAGSDDIVLIAGKGHEYPRNSGH